jgi:hypothetical protein
MILTKTSSALTTAIGRLLHAVPASHRSATQALINDPRRGGHGLRMWLTLMEADYSRDLQDLPGELIAVYLADSDAEPLHDCAQCGLAIPVKATRRCGHEAAVERIYFPTCPCCGGSTGRHAYWSRASTAEVY